MLLFSLFLLFFLPLFLVFFSKSSKIILLGLLLVFLSSSYLFYYILIFGDFYFFFSDFAFFLEGIIHTFKKDVMILQLDANMFVGFLDILSISHIWLTSLLMLICVVLTTVKRGSLSMYNENELVILRILLLLLTFMLFVIFTTLNLFWFFFWFEISLLPMMYIIGFWGSRGRRIMATYRFFIYTLLGSICLFFSLIFIWYLQGTFGLLDLGGYLFTFNQQKLLWLLLFLTFAVKVPIYPFHVWLPEAHAEAPTIGSILLAGVLLKIGPYGLIRFTNSLFYSGFIYWRPLVVVICILGLFYTSFVAICNVDLKKIIAYSSVGHMAFVILGLCADTVEGVLGAIVMMLAHGFVSSGLFLVIGLLYDRYGTRIVSYFGGLGQLNPMLFAYFFFFILGNISFPGTFGFIGEILILFGVYKMNVFVSTLCLLGSVLVLAFNIWLYSRLFGGLIKRVNFYGFSEDLTFREINLILVLLLPTYLFGINSSMFLEGLEYFYFVMITGLFKFF